MSTCCGRGQSMGGCLRWYGGTVSRTQSAGGRLASCSSTLPCTSTRTVSY